MQPLVTQPVTMTVSTRCLTKYEATVVSKKTDPALLQTLMSCSASDARVELGAGMAVNEGLAHGLDLPVRHLLLVAVVGGVAVGDGRIAALARLLASSASVFAMPAR